MISALRVTGLNKNYGNVKAVNDISFEVEKSSITGLLGPNGAGKSTVIRIIMGILSPSSGVVEFSANGDRYRINREKIGYLPEERGLYDDVKVIDNLVYLGMLKGMSKPDAYKEGISWLERLNLCEYEKLKLEKLSKGMQQKVQFIGAVMHKPEIVILDEPFSGLDPINQEVFKNIIKELSERDMTVLLSAHQMDVVEELCDNIFMMNKGRSVLNGKISDIKRSYDEYIIELQYEECEDFEFIYDLPGVRNVVKNNLGLAFCFNEKNDLNNLIRILSSKLKIYEIKAQKPPLHDIFINVVRERGEKIERNQVV